MINNTSDPTTLAVRRSHGDRHHRHRSHRAESGGGGSGVITEPLHENTAPSKIREVTPKTIETPLLLIHKVLTYSAFIKEYLVS
jgi:hypothetical protein